MNRMRRDCLRLLACSLLVMGMASYKCDDDSTEDPEFHSNAYFSYNESGYTPGYGYVVWGYGILAKREGENYTDHATPSAFILFKTEEDARAFVRQYNSNKGRWENDRRIQQIIREDDEAYDKLAGGNAARKAAGAVNNTLDRIHQPSAAPPPQ